MRKEKTLFASSGSLKGIKTLISKFYCGEIKELREEGKEFNIFQPAGEQIKEVFVWKKGNQFRFSSIQY